MTTKKFLKKFHLESLEKLGDSFLKYAVSIQLFKTYEIITSVFSALRKINSFLMLHCVSLDVFAKSR
ncbi:hypothetical protein P3S67_012939 [Capsicum chacoense]